jgi:hypothetical protein
MSDEMKKRLPSTGVVAFKVHTDGVKSFRRAGILFTAEDQTVDASALTKEQQIELLNTRTLNVEEIMGDGKARRAPKASE